MKTGLMPRAELELDGFSPDPYCKLYLPLWKLDGDSFMSKDAYGHLCTRYGTGTPPPAHWTPQGWAFDGVDDYVDIADSLSLGVKYVTIEVWLRWDNTGAASRPYIVDGRAHKYAIYIDKPYEVNFAIMAGGGWRGEPGTNIPEVADGNCHHIVGTYDGSNLKIYFDSLLKQTTPYSGTIDVGPGIARIGCYTPGGADYMIKGLIGEVLIYSRALTPQEILDHYIIGKEMFG